LPEELQLRVNGDAYKWELGKIVHYTEDAFDRYRYWKTWEDAPSARHSLYRSLWELLYAMPDRERRRALDELLAWAGTEPVRRPTHRFLSLAEVPDLARGGLLDIGAHTVTHPALAALPASRQRDEIQQSKATLEEVLGYRVTHFAYPHGTRSDYSSETVAIVREAGFACACSSFGGVVEKSTDRFQLPRVHVQDWNEEEFAGFLSRWLGSQ
jgi:peptidoglycan/xylan/chitin deacetylase (PgdA/CDA1 family)